MTLKMTVAEWREQQSKVTTKKKRGTGETDHQVFVFQVLGLNEKYDSRLKWIYAIPNGGYRMAATAGKMKAEGVKAGILDICLPFPKMTVEPPHSGHVSVVYRCGAYIEMKHGDNKPSDAQREFMDFLRSHGYSVTVAYTCDEALDFIEGYCGIKLKHRGE